VPKGFCHGYSVLSETAEILYKCDEFSTKERGRCSFNDLHLGYRWGVRRDKMILSAIKTWCESAFEQLHSQLVINHKAGFMDIPRILVTFVDRRQLGSELKVLLLFCCYPAFDFS
jgi:hypothetical protein